MKKKSRMPAAYRAIMRDMKSGMETGAVEKALRGLADPYYTSLGLMDIAVANGPDNLDERAADDSLTFASMVDRDWRRAELLGMLCKKLRAWPECPAKEKIREKILHLMEDIPEEARSEAIKNCSSLLCPNRTDELFALAMDNSLKETKHVIKTALENGNDARYLAALIKKIEDGAERAKMLAYLHLQCVKNRKPERFMKEAVESAISIDEEERIEALRYLVKQASNMDDLNTIFRGSKTLKKTDQGRIVAAIAGRADKIGEKERAKEWFDTAESLLSDANRTDRAAIMINIASGLVRLGEKEKGERILRELETEAGKNPGIARKLCMTLEKLGLNSDICSSDKDERDYPTERSGISLVLFNTYEGGGGAAQLRAIARAGPLCIASGLDLVLVEFPYTDLKKTVEKVIKETNIGRGGKYLHQMAQDGRIKLMKKEGLMENGICIATTSHPDERKKIDMKDAVKIARKRPILIIMGLGKHGLPAEFLKSVPYHMELTGKNIPLETCTAMGIIAERIAQTVKNPDVTSKE